MKTDKQLFEIWSGGSYTWEGLGILEQTRWHILAEAINSNQTPRHKYPRAKCPGCFCMHAVVNGRIWNHIIGKKQCSGAGSVASPSNVES